MWKMFCWGLLVGWLVEWVIDWLFWRKNSTSVAAHHSGTGMTGAGLASGLASTGNVGTASAAGSAPAAAALPPGVPSYRAEDLEAIEGIGPKIAELLRNNGVTNFKQLAEAPIDHLVKILDAGGARFKLANPQTWSEQAKLAAAGDWAGFAKLKDELTAGVRLSQDDH